MLDFLKKEVSECAILCGAIKMWITLRIPKMEDGNDFNVSIQEECINTISDVEDEAYSILDSISNYHHTRGSYIIEVGIRGVTRSIYVDGRQPFGDGFRQVHFASG